MQNNINKLTKINETWLHLDNSYIKAKERLGNLTKLQFIERLLGVSDGEQATSNNILLILEDEIATYTENDNKVLNDLKVNINYYVMIYNHNKQLFETNIPLADIPLYYKNNIVKQKARTNLSLKELEMINYNNNIYYNAEKDILNEGFLSSFTILKINKNSMNKIACMTLNPNSDTLVSITNNNIKSFIIDFLTKKELQTDFRQRILTLVADNKRKNIEIPKEGTFFVSSKLCYNKRRTIYLGDNMKVSYTSKDIKILSKEWIANEKIHISQTFKYIHKIVKGVNDYDTYIILEDNFL